MKKNKKQVKHFNNTDEYFNFIKKDNIKIFNVEYTHNYKIKVTYAIIK